MDYSNLNSNSFASKTMSTDSDDASTARVTKSVAKGTIKKKNKIFSGLASDDAGMLKEYIVGDVVLPAIKKVIDDIIVNGIHILLYGDTNTKYRETTGAFSPVTYIGYDRFSERRSSITNHRDIFDPDNIEVATRAEAEEVLDNLGGIISHFGFARVSDLFDLVGITAPYTNNRYGWDSLKGARIERTYKGSYLIIMPKARLLN